MLERMGFKLRTLEKSGVCLFGLRAQYSQSLTLMA
jgi:hypothetical protein